MTFLICPIGFVIIRLAGQVVARRRRCEGLLLFLPNPFSSPRGILRPQSHGGSEGGTCSADMGGLRRLHYARISRVALSLSLSLSLSRSSRREDRLIWRFSAAERRTIRFLAEVGFLLFGGGSFLAGLVTKADYLHSLQSAIEGGNLN